GVGILRQVLRSSSLPVLLGLANALLLARFMLVEGQVVEILRLLQIQTMVFAIVGLIFMYRQKGLLAQVFACGVEAQRLAETDALTGLANRRGLEAEYTRRVSAQEQISLVYVDLDDFKKMNDLLGHDVGDSLIRETARRLEIACRQQAFVSRHGGDEFLILVPHRDLGQVTELARQIRDELKTPFACASGETITLRASVGAALGLASDERLRDMVVRADHALYAAKSTGKGSFVVASQSPPRGSSPHSEGLTQVKASTMGTCAKLGLVGLWASQPERGAMQLQFLRRLRKGARRRSDACGPCGRSGTGTPG
ncbi:MAG TPA: GGDEF domain-containing protein, partial [Rubellimicrobium sp.]|nr:GGDEF domain-containing protein [Rubellimicrobium sp.]